MIILAVRGQGKNLVIYRNFVVKKQKLENIDQNSYIYLKRKLRICRIQIQKEKIFFYPKYFFF